MATEPIVVSGEEEVPAVIARLRATHAAEVPVVVRGRSRFARSRLSFALLRRYAARMGKQVIVASPDPAVQQLAEATGLRSFPVSSGEGRPAAGPTTALTVAPAADEAPGWGSSVREALSAAATQLPELPPPLERLRSRAPGSRRMGLAVYAAAPMLLAIGVCGTLFYGPSARVTLEANGQPYQADVSVTASPSGGPVRIRDVTDTKSLTQSFKTMGQKIVKGAVATGTVTFDASNCSGHGAGFLIPNGTRLRGPNGVEFATNGGDVQIGGDNDTQVDSPIVATHPGTAGNVDGGDFSFEDPGADNGCIQAGSDNGTSGGVDEQRSTAIQQSDLDSARTALQQGLQRQIENELSQGTESGEKLDDSQIIFTPVSFTTDKPIDSPSPTFNATMVLKAEAAYYNASDVTAAFKKAAESHLPADQQLAGKVDAEYNVTASQGGQLTFTGQAKGYAGPRIDLNSVKSQVAGAPIAEAQATLRRLPVQSVAIQEFPFGLPLMPLASSRIDLEYVVTNGPGSAPSS